MSQFSILKKLVNDRFNALQKTGTLLALDHDRDAIWDAYLSGFPEETRQEHNCNCCKAFIRQIGHVVAISSGLRLETLWELNLSDVPNEYHSSVVALHDYVVSRPIVGLFYHEDKQKPGEVGTDQNFSEKHQVIFRHFNVKLPKAVQGNRASASGDLRGTVEVLRRGLSELKPEALEIALELIRQPKGLYRGKEYEHIVAGLQKMQEDWLDCPDYLREKLVWQFALTQPEAVTRARNTAIGTMLIDLSEGMDINQAVGKFEAMVAPSSYKRTTAPVTPRMIEKARKELEDLGMVSALHRRRLDTRDLGPHNALFVHRAAEGPKDVFSSLTGDPPVQTKTLGKIDEMGIEDFLTNVLPSARNLRVLVENEHLPHFVTLTGPQDATAPNLFKWPSSFGWSYAGGVASSMRERVRAAGGSVDGVLRFTHSWNWDEDHRNTSLMDLHVFMPGCTFTDAAQHSTPAKGPRVGWDCRIDRPSQGTQDVDYTGAAPKGHVPIENITFPSMGLLKNGTYTFRIHNWAFRPCTIGGFQAEIELGGQIHKYQYDKPLKNKEWVTVATAELKKGLWTIHHQIPTSSPDTNRWGVTTNRWRRVKAVTLSPNHWADLTERTGQKHYFFLLENCVSDEETRGFYNEFLCNALHDHRKVMELLGGKVEVLPAEGQELSGLGFSETERNHLLIEVEGAFKRIVKVLF